MIYNKLQANIPKSLKVRQFVVSPLFILLACKYLFDKIIYTHIKYIDLYGNLQTRYFINTLPVDEVEFHRLRNSIENQHEYFLNEFDIDKFLVTIAFPD